LLYIKTKTRLLICLFDYEKNVSLVVVGRILLIKSSLNIILEPTGTEQRIKLLITLLYDRIHRFIHHWLNTRSNVTVYNSANIIDLLSDVLAAVNVDTLQVQIQY